MNKNISALDKFNQLKEDIEIQIFCLNIPLTFCFLNIALEENMVESNIKESKSQYHGSLSFSVGYFHKPISLFLKH